MRAHSAAPEGKLGGDPRGSGNNTGNAASIPPALAPRLAGYGIHSLEQWRQLGRLRFQLWGITRKTVAELDRLARGWPQ